MEIHDFQCNSMLLQSDFSILILTSSPISKAKYVLWKMVCLLKYTIFYHIYR